MSTIITGATHQKIIPFLWFDNQAEEAVHFYVSVFPNASIGSTRYAEDGTAREKK